MRIVIAMKIGGVLLIEKCTTFFCNFVVVFVIVCNFLSLVSVFYVIFVNSVMFSQRVLRDYSQRFAPR